MDIDIDLAQARFGMLCSIAVFFVCGLIAGATDWLLFWLLTVAAVIAFLFFSWFHRCPVCGKGLHWRDWHIEYCPYCGNCL